MNLRNEARDAVTDYYAALERLRRDEPRVLASGTRITNDAVSLEAGRARGSIRPSRAGHAELAKAIAAAASEQRLPRDELRKARELAEHYRLLWEEALCREVSLLAELFAAKKALDAERTVAAAEDESKDRVVTRRQGRA